ncbi:NYN domain-containing protein [Bradyrhizobium sp. A11]|uniref:NYN domain-containing protein n=1 Tax=Bradyrhizobium sp. A11 TaxID=3133974 RepID=UPI003248E64C
MIKLGLGLGLGIVPGQPRKPERKMTKYLFVDGGFVESMAPKAERFFGISLTNYEVDYRRVAGGFARTFYYDALPTLKIDEDPLVYAAKLRAKEQLFARVNRTPFMHTREGITRNRSSRRVLQQKGVDILLAIDVFKHASVRNMDEAHIMTCDLDFFPLFEALRDTPVSVHLHCYTEETSLELMALADVVLPVNPFTVLQWMHHPSRDQLVEWNVSENDLGPHDLIKEGTYEGLPFHVFRTNIPGDRPFFGRAMAHNPGNFMRSSRWEFVVADFESRVSKRVYFEDD